jgi:uncharacterized glyoxalase superfamily protein PhnB
MQEPAPRNEPKVVAAIPWLACSDLPATLEFFETRLGFAREWTWGDPPTDGGVSRGEVRLYLVANAELAQRVRGSEISIVVHDVDALYAEHQSKGAPITMPIQNEPWGSREYHVTDPNGYVLRFSGEQA